MTKPKTKFYGSAKRLLSNGGTEADVLELSSEFNITKEDITAWLKNQSKSQAFGQAMFAGKDEKEAIYNSLDQKFVEEYKNVVIYLRGENQAFYEYRGGVYSHLTEKDMYNYADSLMSTYLLLEHRTSSRRVKDTIARVSSLLSRTPKRHFTDDSLLHSKWYLNLKNGLLDMDAFTMLPHSPEYFSTVQVPYEYDTAAVCPEFEKFVCTVSGHNESTGQMIKQMYGYALLRGNPMHKVFYLYGDTARNGKSTAAKILCGLIGWGNVSTLTLQQIASENSSILTSIIGKQINFSDEISSKFIESSRLTAMSAEGVVEINPKYKESFLYPIKTKFIIACNDLPRFSDFQGMKHRMISIPFRYHLKPEERVANYDEVLLQKEGGGILNWAIEGAKSIKDGQFFINDASREDIQDNIDQSYPVYAFLENTYDFGEYVDPVDPKDLYGSLPSKESPATGFRLYCEEQGIKTVSLPIFNREVKRFSRETDKIKQIRWGHRQDRRYVGMKLKSDIDGDKELEDMANSAKL